MEIRLIAPSDAEVAHAFRLRSLLESPSAFAASYEEEVDLPPDQIQARAVCTPENFKVGAFHEGNLVGMGGFLRHARIKRRHAGMLFGMYVAPEMRGQGIGKTILDEIIRRTRELEGIEQITLDVVTPNDPARSLYLRAGFEVFGFERNAMKQGDESFDVEYMMLKL